MGDPIAPQQEGLRPHGTGGEGVASPTASTYRRPWYRRTWRRVVLSLVLAAAIGVAAGKAYLAGVDASGRTGSGELSSEVSEVGRAVTEYSPAERGEPVDISGTTLGGDALALDDLRGDVVVINVWGSWCAPCRAEAPILGQASRAYADEGVSFVGINVRDNEAAALAFERRYDIPYPSIADYDGRTLLSVNDYVPMSAVPVTLVLDREGRVAARALGELRKATLTALLDSAITEAS